MFSFGFLLLLFFMYVLHSFVFAVRFCHWFLLIVIVMLLFSRFFAASVVCLFGCFLESFCMRARCKKAGEVKCETKKIFF